MISSITILGSTGSIGTQALEVAKAHGIKVYALSANRNAELLAKQALEFSVKRVCICDVSKLEQLQTLLAGTDVEILAGEDNLLELAKDTHVDMLLNSVVGMVGLKPTLTAIEAGIPIALANKETLVAGGSLVMQRAAEKNVPIYPVDSEHSAIFQSLQGNQHNKIRKIILTASGGPFYGYTKEQLANVTVEDALNHPNWDMGNKITIDSATLMNKGLEFIEAKWLFDLQPDQIEIVVHRQSVLHSAVEYEDYAVIGQMGVPDMKIPIQYALLYPERISCPTRHLSLTDYGTLTFGKADAETFDCLQAAIDAITVGGTAPAILNAANEETVAAFLHKKIGFLDIARLNRKAMESIPVVQNPTLEEILSASAEARAFVKSEIGA